jgi:hypothetical protein
MYILVHGQKILIQYVGLNTSMFLYLKNKNFSFHLMGYRYFLYILSILFSDRNLTAKATERKASSDVESDAEGNYKI